MIEYFVAKRYMKSKRRLNFITVISRISVLGVSLGVAALIVVLSVFNGFGDLAKKMMLEAEPHLTIHFAKTPDKTEIGSIKKFLRNYKGVSSYYLFSQGKAIIGIGKSFDILTVIGVEDSYYFSDNYRLKKYSETESSAGKNSIAISLYTAIKLNARLGDTLGVTSFQNLEKSVSTFLTPRVIKPVITMIFNTRNNSLNSKYVYMPLSKTKALFVRKNRLAGISVFMKDFKNAGKLKSALSVKNFPFATITTWEDTHKQLLTVMRIERWSAYLILSLIIAIASFNILSSLTMSVTVKQKDIGVMRSFGVSTKSIKKIFLIEGALTGLKGALLGFLIGFSIYLAQLYFHIYSLDATKYIIDALPVKLYFSDVLAITFMALFLAFLSALYPSTIAAKTNVIEAIKWE